VGATDWEKKQGEETASAYIFAAKSTLTLFLPPLPCVRTIERVLERNGLTAPRVRLAPLLPRQEYPGPQARACNELHEVDLVGPVYLKGSGHRYDIWVAKDAFDGAVCLRLAYSRRMDEVLWFLGECWKDLGRPQQVQLDNARELAGWGPAARTLSRVIRLCLRFGVSPVFIPKGEPQFNGGVEHFNGWFQEPLFQRHFQRPGLLRKDRLNILEFSSVDVGGEIAWFRSTFDEHLRRLAGYYGQEPSLKWGVVPLSD
jgi:hypothetical protein